MSEEPNQDLSHSRNETENSWKDMEKLQELMSKVVARKKELIEEKYSYNPLLDEMINSLEATVRSLSDDNAETRLLALLVLDAYYLDFEAKRLLPQFEKMAFSDPDFDVRAFAIRFLGLEARFASAEAQRTIGRKIAEIILDESADMNDRKAAYRALCLLSPDYYVRAKSDDDPHFPADIDWAYVRSWANGK